MPDLKFYPDARSDLVRIWFDVADYSERSADWIADEIERRIKRLSEFPEIGAPRDNLFASCRMLTVRRYVVLYRFDQPLNEVQVMRILEGERDLTELF